MATSIINILSCCARFTLATIQRTTANRTRLADSDLMLNFLYQQFADVISQSSMSCRGIMPDSQPVKQTPSYWAFVLGFVGFTTSFGAHIVAVNLPEYAQQLGVGLAMIGLLIAAYDFAELIAKPIFGAAADRFGMKHTMLLGIVLFTAASLLYPFVNPNLLLLVRFLQGVGAAAFSAVSLALVGAYYA